MTYAPVGAVVFSAYWSEHYTVLSHNEGGSVTVLWHGDAHCVDPRPVRETTHRTPLDRRDKIVPVCPACGLPQVASAAESCTCIEIVLV